ncbi:SRPBCC family protein [Jiangella alba]|uniref:Carbon monoxide dehydrogenase subunit G n=1 Tax=Jiangella alba TaxID=561176 RepID=A0A1H5M409_9ACTN|nr:SRPBCC family protein [Jiangella alba]SEE83507.1 Carbon monoxide dehydrogenase subunit G [Jiangella alba]
MQIDNEFTVGVPVERAWEVLTDLEGIAPCMPGAQLTGRDGDVYKGKVRVKVGPVVSEYAGTATFVEKDDAAHRAVISASGRDSRGAGNASAQIVAQLRPDGASTVVSVDTDLRISGKIAQLGRGMIKEVSTKLLGQFVECLEGKLGAAPEAPVETVAEPVAEAAAEPVAEPVAQPEPATPRPAAAEPEPLDIMGVAGGSIARRAVPLVLVLIVLVGLVLYLASR